MYITRVGDICVEDISSYKSLNDFGLVFYYLQTNTHKMCSGVRCLFMTLSSSCDVRVIIRIVVVMHVQ